MIGRAVLADLLNKKSFQLKMQVRNGAETRRQIGNSLDLTKVEMLEGDFTRLNEHQLDDWTKGCCAVIHAAGLVHKPEAIYQEYEVVNVRATQQLAEAAAKNGVKTFVFLSTSAVYGPGPFSHISESAPTKALTPYAVSKLTSENWLTAFEKIPQLVILRPSLVFGEGDRGNLLSLIREVKNNRYIHIGEGSTTKSVIYSKDLAQAINLCISKLGSGKHLFNIANPEPVSMKQLTETIAKTLNLSNKIATVPESLARFGVKAAQALMQSKTPVTSEQLDKLTTTTTCSIDKLRTAVGFTPQYTLESALKAEIAWATDEKLI
jgi:nucleoside-diphosphate-sugar epimerase